MIDVRTLTNQRLFQHPASDYYLCPRDIAVATGSDLSLIHI